MSDSIRLDRFLANALDLTRTEAKGLLRQGRVSVNGAVVLRPELKVSQEDLVALDGRALGKRQKYLYYLLNKPAGVVSASFDETERTVLDLIPKERRRSLFPVGRLDKDTEGLLLITDDGALAHKLLSPRSHVDKDYFAVVRGIMDQEDIRRFETGIDIGENELTMPAKLHVMKVRPEEGISEVLITIQEGKFHQVKRMVAACGKEVLYLKRTRMGNLSLPADLKTGEWREIKREDI